MNIKIDIHKNHVLDRKIMAVSDWKVPKSVKKDILKHDKTKLCDVCGGQHQSHEKINGFQKFQK